MLPPSALKFIGNSASLTHRVGWDRRLIALCVGAACSGTLYFLSWPGYGVWPLSLVAFVPLLWILERTRATRGSQLAVALGWVSGIVKSVGGFYWLYETLLTFARMPRPACALLAALIWIYQGSSLALFSWLYVRARSHRLGVLPSAVCALCVVEWAFPELFPHYFGLSLHRFPRALQIADLAGPLSVTAVLMSANVAALALLSRLRVATARDLTWAASLCAATFAYGSYRVHEVDTRIADARKIEVVVIQANLSVEEKRRENGGGLRPHFELSAAVSPKPHLIVWPETVADYDDMEGLPQALREHAIGTPVLFGARLRHEDDAGMRRYANAALLADAQGNVTAGYHKIKLLPFAEYVPFGESHPSLYTLLPRPRRFVPGVLPPVLQFGELRLGVSVCYEDIFANFIADGVREHGPHLLVNLTNDAWFGDTIEPHQHAALAKLRAVEHHRSFVRATNSGVSEIVDPVGRELSVSGVFVSQTLRAVVPLLEGQTVYSAIGDALGYAAALVLLAAYGCARWRASVSVRE
jgi:apolipoprotein N-acyltransferase